MSDPHGHAVRSAAANVVTLTDDRDRSIRLAIALLTLLSAVGVIALRWAGYLDGATFTVQAVFVSVPILGVMAFALARTGYVLPAGAATIAAAAYNAIIVAQQAPGLVPIASTYLMLAALLILGAQVMPFEVAAGLGMTNVVLSLALPSFIPAAGADAVRIPYVFLFLNAAFLLFAGILRTRDRGELVASTSELQATEDRLLALDRQAKQQQAENEERLRGLLAQIDRQRRMLNAASHELRTPITPLLIKMAAFRMRYDGSLTPDQQRSITLLERNLKRMALLVEDLLDVSRMEEGELDLRFADCDAHAIVREACDTFAGQAADRGVQIHLDADVHPLRADARRLSQVVYNLLSNAIKYSPDGRSVHVTVGNNAQGVQVDVRDEGPGLSPEQQTHLFEPFGQVHDTGVQLQGTGLGLYISRSIITEHGGQMWVRSDGRGRGATFSFWVPREPKEVDADVALPALQM